MRTEFDWFNDIPGDHFTGDNILLLFEYAQLGDRVYVQGRTPTLIQDTVDDFGTIINIEDNGTIIVQLDDETTTMEKNIIIPDMYRLVPELYVEEQGFIGEYVVKRGCVCFENVVPFYKPIGRRKVFQRHYDKLNFHIIHREYGKK
jgi:hypothetical protein